MKKIIFALIAITLILPFACNPKEEIAPENPCGDKPDATFTYIEEAWQKYNSYNKTNYSFDTVLVGSNVHFECLNENIEYKWSVLGDPSFSRNTKSFDLVIGNETTFTVQLIVKNSDTLCYPNKNNYDTFSRVITSKYMFNCAFKGTYTGSLNTNPSDVFSVRFTFDSVVNVSYTAQIWFNGIPKNCKNDLTEGGSNKLDERGFNIFKIYTSGVNNCDTRSLEGWGIIDSKANTLIFDYTNYLAAKWEKDNPFRKIFTGKRNN
jgi:hypothetical protein